MVEENKKYRIIVKVMGDLIHEYYTDDIEKAKELFWKTGFDSNCFTGCYVDGELLTIAGAEKLLDPDGTYRKKSWTENEKAISSLYGNKLK